MISPGVVDCTVFGGALVEQVVGVPRLPESGQDNVPMGRMAILPGGAGGNVAVYLARLGFTVRLIDKWGTDRHSDFLKTHMQDENVDLAGVRYLQEMPTPFMIILTLPGGDWSGITRLPDLANIGPADMDIEHIANTRFIHIHAFNLGSERGRDGAVRAAEAANRSGASVSLDACTPMAVSEPDAILALVPQCEILFANRVEAQALTGQDDLQSAARSLLDLGALNVVIKAGEAGCYGMGVGQSDVFHVPAHEVKVVDTIGAGDGVVAGTLAGIMQGRGLQEFVRIGVAVSALVCEGIGAQSRAFTSMETYERAAVEPGGPLDGGAGE